MMVTTLLRKKQGEENTYLQDHGLSWISLEVQMRITKKRPEERSGNELNPSLPFAEILLSLVR